MSGSAVRDERHENLPRESPRYIFPCDLCVRFSLRHWGAIGGGGTPVLEAHGWPPGEGSPPPQEAPISAQPREGGPPKDPPRTRKKARFGDEANPSKS